MILAQPELRAEVEAGRIAFDPPLEERQWGEASVDLRLGFTFTRFRRDIDLSGITLSVAEGLQTVGKIGIWEDRVLPNARAGERQERFELEPGAFVLAMTYESIKIPRNHIALVEGRSTYARVGLSMHQTAPWIQPGWEGPIILEIMNHGPLTLALTPVVDRPCQLSFFQLSSELPQTLAYGSRDSDRYLKQRHALKHEPEPD
jgi:dCTP deaminase